MNAPHAPVRRVIVGVDLLERPDEVTDRASRLRLGAGARITFLHVLPPATRPSAGDEAATALRALGAGVRGRRPETGVDVAVRRGDPASEIALAAREERADLVIVGRARTAGLRRLVAASVAERVAALSDAPVLAVSGIHRSPYRRSLVAIELPSATSSEAVGLARELLDAETSDCHVLYTIEDTIERRMQRGGAPRHAILMARRWIRSRVRGQITSWLRRGGGSGEPRLWLGVGRPGVTIPEVAGRTFADLIALGAAHRWLRHGILRPSVAGTVLAQADCDVLLVRSAPPRKGPVARTSAAA